MYIKDLVKHLNLLYEEYGNLEIKKRREYSEDDLLTLTIELDEDSKTKKVLVFNI